MLRVKGYVTMSVRDIVIAGIKPAADVSETQHHAYRELALLVLIQFLSKPIVKQIAKLQSRTRFGPPGIQCFLLSINSKSRM